MSASRHLTSTSFRRKSSAGRKQKHSSTSFTKVLAERNQAVVPEGAWVEVEQDFRENPSALALHTEEIQAAQRRENEENLQRFQRDVRRRVAEHAHFTRRRQQNLEVINHYWQVWTDRAGSPAQHSVNDGDFQEPREAMRRLRLRLAACRLSPSEETASQLPGAKWIGGHTAASHMNQEDETQEGDGQPFAPHHECLLVKQKPPGHTSQESKPHSKLAPDPSFQWSSPRVLWPLADPEEEQRKQHQSHFLTHRRLCMNVERRQVKEQQQLRKHIKETASIKAEKERLRLQEERRLERELQLAAERRRLQARGQLERLRQEEEEEEERAAELRRRQQEKEKVDARFTEALKAQLKERLSQGKKELPPLCLCAASFWDTHPETCANNCSFHNNPKAYAKALHSTMLTFGSQ